jgi:hypothetical protein
MPFQLPDGLQINYADVLQASITVTGWPLDKVGVYIVRTDPKTGLFAKPTCEFGRSQSRGQNLEKVLRWTSGTYSNIRVSIITLFHSRSFVDMIQKTVSDLALKSTNRIPAMPLSQQEASTIKRILDSVSICPNEREPRLISLQATEVHPLLQSYVDQWPARAILQLICSNLTSRGAGKRSKPRGASVPPLPSTGLSRTQSRLSSVGPPTQDLGTSARTKKSVRIKTS